MMPKHDCHHCCLNRRQCLQFLSASALGAGMLTSQRRSAADDQALPSNADFVDPAGLRPNPKVRVAAAFLEMPRPYWLGWPGTTYELDKHQQAYRTQLAKSAQTLGVDVGLESSPIDNKEAVSAWVQKIAVETPDALLVMLQHLQCWSWVTEIAQQSGVPVLVFAPVGTAFTGHVRPGFPAAERPCHVRR